MDIASQLVIIALHRNHFMVQVREYTSLSSIIRIPKILVERFHMDKIRTYGRELTDITLWMLTGLKHSIDIN